ncbi:UNVERIFIED_ORG: toxic protein SymE [Enterobacter sp. JUb101]|nr:toxic protein SymE [Lelliottia amnigena]
MHGKSPTVAAVHPRADTLQNSAACCELHSRAGHYVIPLAGAWLLKAGFIDGMPVKIRVMLDCIIITPQNTRELWGCLEGMSVAAMNKQRIAEWLKTFPGALNDTGNVPVVRRGM